jgi:hypothetical protein
MRATRHFFLHFRRKKEKKRKRKETLIESQNKHKMSTREVPLKLSNGGDLRRVRLNSHYGIIAFDVLVSTAKASFPELSEKKLHFTWLDDGKCLSVWQRFLLVWMD